MAACDAACRVWNRSGCFEHYRLTTSSCLDTCTAVSKNSGDGMMWNNDGWGWGYVNCIESVAWGFESHPDEKSCSRMTSLCRNVFQTGTLDEFGVGKVATDTDGSTARPVVAAYVALATALVAAAVIMFFMNGGSFRKDPVDHSDIQFTEVRDRNEEVE